MFDFDIVGGNRLSAGIGSMAKEFSSLPKLFGDAGSADGDSSACFVCQQLKCAEQNSASVVTPACRTGVMRAPVRLAIRVLLFSLDLSDLLLHGQSKQNHLADMFCESDRRRFFDGQHGK